MQTKNLTFLQFQRLTHSVYIVEIDGEMFSPKYIFAAASKRYIKQTRTPFRRCPQNTDWWVQLHTILRHVRSLNKGLDNGLLFVKIVGTILEFAEHIP